VSAADEKTNCRTQFRGRSSFFLKKQVEPHLDQQ